METTASPGCCTAKAVIFDVDGTLIDSVDAHAESWTETLRAFGHNVQFADVRSQIGKGGDLLMAEFLPKGILRAQGKQIETARKNLFVECYLRDIRGFPQTRELFQELLRRGIKVTLASSAEGDELKTYKEKAGIADLVADETSKDDAEKSKPHPDIFEAAIAKLEGLGKAEMLVVGDSPWDAIAAEKAGLVAVGVLSGGFPKADLLRAGFRALYRDPADLLQNCDLWLALENLVPIAD